MDWILKDIYSRTTQSKIFLPTHSYKKKLARYTKIKSEFIAFIKTVVPKEPEN